MAANVLDTVLLLALPASGKSEVRRYLDHPSDEESRASFHMGPTVQLDDYPYVHLMRRIDDALEASGRARAFFAAADRGFADTRDWGTLIELVNEDYARLCAGERPAADDPAAWLFERIDRAREAVGAPPLRRALEGEARDRVAAEIADDARQLINDLGAATPETLDGRTVVIEFARGGPEDAKPPLPGGYGYGYSLAHLSAQILERAAILYIWVTPEQSRAKNRARARPDADGSILFHGVPEHVMRNDYGRDDMEWLLERSDRPGTVRVEAHGRVFHLPAARFDNRTDLTSFLRGEPQDWPESAVAQLREGLRAALDRIWQTGAGRRRDGTPKR